MKKPDLLILIAIWEFLYALGGLIGISAISIFAFPEAVGTWYGWGVDVGAVFGLSIALLTLLCVSSISVAGGIGLLMGKEWGRIVSIAQAALSLFFFPVGTIIGVLVIIYLIRADIKEYFTSTKE